MNTQKSKGGEGEGGGEEEEKEERLEKKMKRMNLQKVKNYVNTKWSLQRLSRATVGNVLVKVQRFTND